MPTQTPQLGNGSRDDDFAPRLQSDAATLAKYRETLRVGTASSVILGELQSCAHKLAGAAAVFGYQTVSDAASTLEDCIIDGRGCHRLQGTIAANLDALLDCLDTNIRHAAVTANVSD
jgi:HPt (histidine-containing phosphotransfer) domain-containing protein